MKKLAFVLALALLCCLSLSGLAAEGPFVPGEDTAEYAVEGASGWNTVTAYVKIEAGEDVLYNGAVTLTSDGLYASEFTYAAITEMGLSSEGVQEGFISSIGDYASGNDANGNSIYWGYTVNGKYVPFACNQMRVLEGDYIHWTLQTYDPEAGLSAETLPTGYDAPFTAGEDTAEYAIEGASGWTSGNINVQIIAGEDVLFDGVVSLTSDTMLASEVTFAAITEMGLSSEGVMEGFVTSIGDYVSGNDANGNYVYWGYTVNGKTVPFACNEMPLLDQDYLLWTLQTYIAE